MKKLCEPMVVTPPPPCVPRFSVTNSRKTLSSPIFSDVVSPWYFRSCGGPPRGGADGGVAEEPIALADRGRSFDACVRADDGAGADGDVRADQRERADFDVVSERCFVADDGSGMNSRHRLLGPFCHDAQ